MNFSFRNIQVFAELEKETEDFKHYKLDEVKNRYDSNFIEFKVMPTMQQLQDAERDLKQFQRLRGQQFLKFVFPQDDEIPFEIRHYLSEQDYSIEIMEMYAIHPNVFTKEILNTNVVVEFLTKHDLSSYLALHFDESFKWGESYEEDKQNMLTRNFKEQRKAQIIAKIDGQVVGSVDVIVEKDTAEIDNFYVLPQCQRQGIGTKIQQFAMEQYSDKTILLVADGEDTPREMYTKQGYSYIGKQYSAIKTSLD